MTTTDMDATPAPTATGTTADEFASRLLGAVLGAQEVQAVYLGEQLGWYRALAGAGPLTSTELAGRTGTAERYAREWLEHQAVCGYLTVGDPGAGPTERRYVLPPGHAEVLTDEDSLAYVAPLARFVTAAGRHLDSIAEAYRTGEGVSWERFGDEAREAQAAANRPLFLHQLGQEILPSLPDVHARLTAGGRVADLGCGAGWSSIGIALAYPQVTVDGFDVDAPSVEMARRFAAEAGVADRVRFHASDGATLGPGEGAGAYDAVFAFECVHDLSDPTGFLAAMGRLAGPDGVVIVMDERTEKRFTAPASETERLFYGYSLTCCLPDGLSRRPSVGTGTVMRPDTLAAYATDAGFGTVEVLPVENDFFRFYRLHH